MLQWLTRAFSAGGVRMASITGSASKFQEPSIPTETATFAMGCFWAPEPIFGGKKGVIRTKVGYTGGTKVNPTYRSLGDHTEAIQIEYDPTQTDYKAMLDVFWTEHDPTSKHKAQYKSAIYYHNELQHQLAEQTKAEYQKKFNRPIVTDIEPFGTFYDAENYHQKYHLREHVSLYNSFNLSDSELIRSHVATRIHGYLYGYGAKENFDKDARDWQLSESQIEYIKKQLAHPRPIECGL
ncbi:peptide methionine sulfoxide reductase-like [Paramacrobiotus metropolitanus]|uniref:peptide methionine sulfoxide reductase-like n=1 Tax=Paramacrobiotus metropolitanus TaxID=2943436 RepID=UPI002445DBC7|nr:peptide methionine sulfoxide reductase-like [Paramacrobiotus metropolitanus]